MGASEILIARSSRMAGMSDRPLKILVVDDDAAIVWLMQRLLASLGHDVVTAASAAEALTACEQQLPELVLCDIEMPEMDGLAFARRFRERFGGAGLLIAATGNSGAEHLQAIQSAGFDELIVKPIGLPTLRALLSTLPHGAAQEESARPEI